MRKPLSPLLILLFCIACFGSVGTAAENPPVTPFRDGDSVCFLGDSITKAGGYQKLIELYYANRFPVLRIAFFNCGVGGDRASAIMSTAGFRVETDVLAHKPTIVTIMLGMNDVERSLYEPGKPAPDASQKREAALHAYEENMRALVQRIQASGARVILLTPSMYDETVKLEKVPALTGVNGALAKCCDIVRRLSEELHTELADVFTAMNTLNNAAQKRDPSFSLLGAGQSWNDRVHPGPAGNYVIAGAFLRSQGFAVESDPAAALQNQVPGLDSVSQLSFSMADRRRQVGDQLREIATFRYAMAKEGLDPLDSNAFTHWLNKKQADAGAKGQKTPWYTQVLQSLPREKELQRRYDSAVKEIRAAVSVDALRQ